MSRTLREAEVSEPAEARLQRILRLPQTYEGGLIALTALGTAVYGAVPTLYYADKNPWTIAWAIVTVVLLCLLSGIHRRLMFEQVLRPHAIQEFQRHPELDLGGAGFSWPRYRWYLPYAFALFILCALVVSFTVLGQQARPIYEQVLAQVDAASPGQASPLLRAAVSQVIEAPPSRCSCSTATCCWWPRSRP
ncbi:hypothetical protein ACN28S_16850 [Cystobacter fuscus]